MKAARLYLSLGVILTAVVLVNAFDPMLAAVVGGFIVTPLMLRLANYTSHVLSTIEICNPDWISLNASGLKADLENKLFGQHIASRIVLNSVTGFMSDDNPRKPLVLSLHGPTGTGKNFVTRLIAENIYKKGMDSGFVHVYSSPLHFPHKDKVDVYKSQLQLWIKESVITCERSMFIFDEMDDMPHGLIDSIVPYLDHHGKLDGVSYRKAIFIFLSNAGGEGITRTALNFWREGQDRKEIKLKDLETSLSVTAFNKDNSGLHHSGLINKNLVDFFVPFLPLEYQHLVQCVLAEMKARGLQPDKNVADEMAKDLIYVPKSERVFSAPGCKTIRSRLNHYIS